MMELDLEQASDGSLMVAVGRWRQDALAEVYRRRAGALFALSTAPREPGGSGRGRSGGHAPGTSRTDSIRLAVPSEDERQGIQLAYFGGHTYSEVATMLQTAAGTVKGRMRSALAKLRQELVATGAVSE